MILFISVAGVLISYKIGYEKGREYQEHLSNFTVMSMVDETDSKGVVILASRNCEVIGKKYKCYYIKSEDVDNVTFNCIYEVRFK